MFKIEKSIFKGWVLHTQKVYSKISQKVIRFKGNVSAFTSQKCCNNLFLKFQNNIYDIKYDWVWYYLPLNTYSEQVYEITWN